MLSNLPPDELRPPVKAANESKSARCAAPLSTPSNPHPPAPHMSPASTLTALLGSKSRPVPASRAGAAEAPPSAPPALRRAGKISARQPLATTMMARPPVKNGGQNNARLSAPCQSVSNPCQSVSNPRPALGPWSIRAKVPRRTGPPVNASKSVKIRQISDPARAPTIPLTHVGPPSLRGRF